MAKLLKKAAPLGKVKPGVSKKWRGRIGSEALLSAYQKSPPAEAESTKRAIRPGEYQTCASPKRRKANSRARMEVLKVSPPR